MKLTVNILASLCCLVFAEEETQVCRGEGSWCAESNTEGIGLLQQQVMEGKFSVQENSHEEADQLPAPGSYQRISEPLPHDLQPVRQWTVELPVGTKLVLKNPKNSDGPVSLMQGMEDYKKGKTETSPFVVKGLSDWVLPMPQNADAELLLPAEGSGSDATTTTEAPGAPTTGSGSDGITTTTAPTTTPVYLANFADGTTDSEAEWAVKCQELPASAAYVKISINGCDDYFKPTAGNSMCDMLTSKNKHLWSSDGASWVQPAYHAAAVLGGSLEDWPKNSGHGQRIHLTFWGRQAGGDGWYGCQNPADTIGAWHVPGTMSVYG